MEGRTDEKIRRISECRSGEGEWIEAILIGYLKRVERIKQAGTYSLNPMAYRTK